MPSPVYGDVVKAGKIVNGVQRQARFVSLQVRTKMRLSHLTVMNYCCLSLDALQPSVSEDIASSGKRWRPSKLHQQEH